MKRATKKTGQRSLAAFDGAIRNLANLGKSADEIAAFVRRVPVTVRKYCKEQGIELKRPPSPCKAPTERDKALCELFQQGNSLQAVGDVYGITRERVRQILVRNNIFERNLWTFANSSQAAYAQELYELGEPREVLEATFNTSAPVIYASFRSRVSKKRRRTNQFWRSVAITADPERCWEWQGGVGPGGYGRVNWAGRVIGTHVLSYTLCVGKPTKWVLHTCDNPQCCNPKHLYEGTPLDNARDRDQRGRGAHQNGNSRRRLAPEEVELIRTLLAEGVPQMQVAERLGVHYTAINHVNTGKTWKKPRGLQQIPTSTLKVIYDDLRAGKVTNAHIERKYGLHLDTIRAIKRGTHSRVKKMLSEAHF